MSKFCFILFWACLLVWNTSAQRVQEDRFVPYWGKNRITFQDPWPNYPENGRTIVEILAGHSQEKKEQFFQGFCFKKGWKDICHHSESLLQQAKFNKTKGEGCSLVRTEAIGLYKTHAVVASQLNKQIRVITQTISK